MQSKQHRTGLYKICTYAPSATTLSQHTAIWRFSKRNHFPACYIQNRLSKMVLARWCSSTLQPHNRLTRHPIPWALNTTLWVHTPRSPETTQTGLYLQHHPKEMIYTLRRFAVLHISSRKSPTHVIILVLQSSATSFGNIKHCTTQWTVDILITLCATLIDCPVMQIFQDTLYIQ
jgi:hypothetical protein